MELEYQDRARLQGTEGTTHTETDALNDLDRHSLGTTEWSGVADVIDSRDGQRSSSGLNLD